jgi:hypothetical protein
MRLRVPVLLVLLSCVLAVAQQNPRTYRGSWTAHAGAQTLHGRWTGRALPGRPDIVRGTWELTNDAGAAVMRGTWSAERQAQAWQGSFVARSAPNTFAGRWTAYLDDTNVKTLEGMLQRALQKEVSGAWQAGQRFGNWWLGGP